MIRGQTSSGVESGVLNNQIEIKFYSKLDDGLSAQLIPAQKPMKKNNNKNIQWQNVHEKRKLSLINWADLPGFTFYFFSPA